MKKYNLIILLALVFSLTASQSFAQGGAPGLYGKRLFIEFGTSIGGSLYGSTSYNENNEGGNSVNNLFEEYDLPFRFNNNYQLSAHYAISRLSTVGMAVTYSRTGMIAPSTSINANINSTNLNFFIRKYYISDGSIAPIGKYAQFGISAMVNNRTFTESELAYTDPQVITSQIFVSPAINLELGRETVINDKFLYSFAFQSSFAFPFGMDEVSRYSPVEEFGDIAGSMFGRLLSYYIFRFKFAVGLPVRVQK
jgi:hypothetical protein